MEYSVGMVSLCLPENLITPYPGLQSNGSPQRVFNYRLYRARRVVENIFVQLTAVFLMFRGSINLGCIHWVVLAYAQDI
jgi:hypothetical protein